MIRYKVKNLFMVTESVVPLVLKLWKFFKIPAPYEHYTTKNIHTVHGLLILTGNLKWFGSL